MHGGDDAYPYLYCLDLNLDLNLNCKKIQTVTSVDTVMK